MLRNQDRHYVVVMDDASYFQDYDFNFNITRMAYSLEEVKKSPYFRVDREGIPQIISQGKKLQDTFVQNDNQKSILLCDDGVGTGKSLKEILEILEIFARPCSGYYVRQSRKMHFFLQTSIFPLISQLLANFNALYPLVNPVIRIAKFSVIQHSLLY